jgi:hypothetical protein
MMSSKKRALIRHMKANPLDSVRSAHKNMDITPKRMTYRIDPNKELKERDEKPLEEVKINQNYDIWRRDVKILKRSGKKVIKYVKNNPPGKRYYPLSESKIAKGDQIEGKTVIGTTFADYNNKRKSEE